MDPQPGRVEKFNQAVRGTVTLILVACFCYGFIIKEIDGGLFAQTVTLVITFWFATRGGQNPQGPPPIPNGPPPVPIVPETKP